LRQGNEDKKTLSATGCISKYISATLPTDLACPHPFVGKEIKTMRDIIIFFAKVECIREVKASVK